MNAFLYVITLIGVIASTKQLDAHAVDYSTIKVLIAHHTAQHQTYEISASHDLIVTNELKKTSTLPGNSVVNIDINDHRITLKSHNKKKIIQGKHLVIGNKDHSFTLNNKEYRGKIIIQIDQTSSTTYVINELNLEDYVCSVLRSECIPYWPLEIQKVQAVASRSYAAYHIYLNRHQQRPYDIKNCTKNQIYDGHHHMERLHTAVQETERMIMMYENRPVLAMFDVCCGGIIPSTLAAIDHRKPYLYRTYPCTYCAESSSFTWNTTMHTADFMTALHALPHIKKKMRSFGGLLSIECISQPLSGIVDRIILHGSRHSFDLPLQDLKKIFHRQIKSPAFSCTKKFDTITLSGKGFGHYHGLCQCGARNLVKQGWKFKKILNFYYPDISFARIKKG